MNTYFALVHKDAGSAYGISFPDLPGCFSAADEECDIFTQAQAALALYACDGEKLPEARQVSALQKDREIRAEIAAGAFLIAVPLISIRQKARYNLMLAKDLVAGIDKTVKALGMNRSEFVTEAVTEKLKQQAGVVFRRVKKREAVSHSLRKTSKVAKPSAASTLTQKTKNK